MYKIFSVNACQHLEMEDDRLPFLCLPTSDYKFILMYISIDVYIAIANLESKTCIKVTLKMKGNGCFHRDAYFIFIKCYVGLFKPKVNCFGNELLLREMSLITEALRPCPAVVSHGHNVSEKDLLELLCLAA